jgi:hypothetical protein
MLIDHLQPIFRLLNEQRPELARKTFLEHATFYVSIPWLRLTCPLWSHLVVAFGVGAMTCPTCGAPQ